MREFTEIQTGTNPALQPDENAKYSATFVVDLDLIDEPMIADPDVQNVDISKGIPMIPSGPFPITEAINQ